MKTLVDRIREEIKNANAKLVDPYFDNDDLLKLCDAIELLIGALPGIPDECGEHSHLGISLDHKDCDEIREVKSKVQALLKIEDQND